MTSLFCITILQFEDLQSQIRQVKQDLRDIDEETARMAASEFSVSREAWERLRNKAQEKDLRVQEFSLRQEEVFRTLFRTLEVDTLKVMPLLAICLQAVTSNQATSL